MKKIFTIFLAILVLVQMLPAAVLAAGETPLSLVATVNEGSVTVKVTSAAEFVASSLSFKISVPSGCSLTAIAKGADFDSTFGGGFIGNVNTNQVSCTASNAESDTTIPADKELVTFTATVNADAIDIEKFTFGITNVVAADVNDEETAWSGGNNVSNEVNNPIYSPDTGDNEQPASTGYEIYYTLDDSAEDSDSNNYMEYNPGSTVTANLYLKNKTGAEAVMQAYDVYLEYSDKLSYQSDTMDGVAYVTQEGAASLSAIVAGKDDKVTHVQAVSEGFTPVTLAADAEVLLGSISFKIAETGVAHGDKLPITIKIGENDKTVTNISVGLDKTSYYPVNGGTVLGAEVSGVYTVTWKNQDGTLIETDEDVAHGTAFSSIAPANPSKAADNTYTYEFAGWATAENAESGKMAADLGNVTGDVTYYAAFSKTAIQYTVTYSDDGTTSTAQTGYNGKITLPSAKGKTGYTFQGWYSGENKVGDAGAEYTVTTDITLTAKYTANTYTVRFHPGSKATGTMADQTFTYDEAAKELSANTFTPNDNKYVFAGWATSDDSEEIVYTDKQAVQNLTADIDLYPVWKQDVYQITYVHPDDVTVSTQLDGTYSSEDGLTLKIPEAPGYTFEGWYDNADFDGTPATEISKGTTGEQKFYSKWTPNADTKYTVKHWQQNTDLATEQNDTNYTLKDTDNLTGTTATQVTPTVKEYTGFTAPETQTVAIKADGSTVVNYYYTRNKYKVTLNPGDGTIDGENVTEYVYGVGATLPNVTPPAGYTFGGNWNDGEKTVTSITATDTGDKTLTAQFDAISYKIFFDFDGGALPENFNWGTDIDYDVETKSLTYNITNTVNLPVPTKDYYTFRTWKVTTPDGSWTMNAEVNTSFTGMHGNATLTAQWDRAAKPMIEEYKYAFRTLDENKNETSGYRMIRVDATDVAEGKEYKFNGKSMYYTTDSNYLVDSTSDTGVFYTLISTEYVDGDELTKVGYDLLTIGDVVGGNRATINYNGDINGDNVLNIADANIVYQMVINGGGYYSDGEQANGQLDIAARLKADMSKDSAEHRGSINDVDKIINKINGVVETATN